MSARRCQPRDPACSMPIVITYTLATVAACFAAGYTVAAHLYNRLTTTPRRTS